VTKQEEIKKLIDESGGVRNQGKAVCEADGDGWLVMLPDGQVVYAKSKPDATKKINKWLKADLKKNPAGAGVCTIEWRS
jgi:hypothetical protein